VNRGIAPLLIGAWLFVGSSALAGQDGQVIDQLSGGPVPMAQILWKTAGPEAESVDRIEADVRGRFRLSSKWRGQGWIEVRSLGHRTLIVSRAEAEASAWRLSLAPDPLKLESILVTAAGRSQRRSEIAVPIALVTAAEIQSAGAPSVESLLSEMPGLQSQAGTPTGSNIMIRGIGDSRVLVLIDGQPASGALLENRDLSRLSLAGVERVEVVKGPLSSLYGTDALGGVINIVTTDPSRGFRADARALSGVGGRYEADATVSGGGDFRYRATGSWRQQDHVPGLDDATGAFARVWDVRTSLRHLGTDDLLLRGDVSFVRERQRWPIGGGFSGFNDNRGVTAWTQATLARFGGEWSAKAFAQDYEHLYRSARGDAPIVGADDNLQKERFYRGTVMYSTEPGSHQLDVGLESSHRQIESPNKILEDQASDDQLDLFAQDAWTLGPATVSGGLRASFNDRWGNTASPTFGVTAMSGSSVRTRAVVGRGFRAPSFKELAWDFANLGGGYTVQGNPDLEPETSWNVTAGIDWAPSAAMSFGVEGYTNHIDNLIESNFIGNTPSGLLIYSPRNVSRARTRGIEATGSRRQGVWEARAEYVLLDARSLDEDLPLDRRARHSGRVRLTRSFDLLRGLLVNATVHATGDAPILGLDSALRPVVIDTQERLVSVDAQASFQLPHNLMFTLGVDNLLDARPDGWQAVIERRFRIGIEARDLF
jgi:outer membrane receptor for ferrienterochelin and colicins